MTPSERVARAWDLLCAELEPRRWRFDAPGPPLAPPTPDACEPDRALDSQRELLEGLARALADSRSAGSVDGAVRVRQGNPDRARPGTLWLRDAADAARPTIVRARWLPPNLYRAMGFALKLEDDCRWLRRQVAAGRAAAGLACFVDLVGVISPERAAGWRARHRPVEILGWSARWGRLP